MTINLSTQQVQSEIGRKIRHDFAGLKVVVSINDVKYSYGNKRYLVSIFGQDSNLVWINAPVKPDFVR